MSQGKSTKCLFSIEVFDDNTIAVHWGDRKTVRKIKNPVVLAPILFSMLVIPFGTDEVKDMQTWLDRVWIKKLKKSET